MSEDSDDEGEDGGGSSEGGVCSDAGDSGCDGVRSGTGNGSCGVSGLLGGVASHWSSLEKLRKSDETVGVTGGKSELTMLSLKKMGK